MLIEILKMLFMVISSIVNALVSAFLSILSFYNSISPIVDAFSIDYIICGILGIPVSFAFIIKFIRIKTIKFLKF